AGGSRERRPRGVRRRGSDRDGHRHGGPGRGGRAALRRRAAGDRAMTGRIAVAVSGVGSNLRALHAAEIRRELGGEIVLVVADRECPAVDWAAEQGIDTAIALRGTDDALFQALAGARPDVVVLAGYLRIVGPRVLDAYRGRILNTHPSLLPS